MFPNDPHNATPSPYNATAVQHPYNPRAVVADQAQALFDQLREGLLNVETSIKAIIDTRAWEQLGYQSLTEAWGAQLSNVRISQHVQVHLLYAMFAEGTDIDQIEQAIHGVGPQGVNAYHDAWMNNLSPKDALTHANAVQRTKATSGVHVKAHFRHNPTSATRVTLAGFTKNELATLRDMAKRNDMSINAFATAILRELAATYQPAAVKP